MVRYANGDSPRIAANQVAQRKLFAIWYKPSDVAGPRRFDLCLSLWVKPMKRRRGEIGRINRNDESLGEGASLEVDESQHRIVIAGITCEPPHTFGCVRDYATPTETEGGPLFVKPGQGS